MHDRIRTDTYSFVGNRSTIELRAVTFSWSVTDRVKVSVYETDCTGLNLQTFVSFVVNW